MAGTSLFALIDDIATVLDDISVMTKVAARKTAGVLGDDLALNAQQVVGVLAERELPVVWAVAKGSLKNKVILIPAALLISAVAPWAITPLLMLGGAFLCYEGAEKLAHRFLHSKEEEQEHQEQLSRALLDPGQDMAAFERQKIRGAIRTDFVLSAEIIVITLGVVADKPFLTQLAVLVGIGMLMTIGVYGLVAGIVKLDDVGLYLRQRANAGLQALGTQLIRAAPLLMKALAIVGTAAMFLVGGGILLHGLPSIEHWIHDLAHGVGSVPMAGPLLETLTTPLFGGLVGIAAGALILVIVTLAARFRRSSHG
jgi:predicted DNA repair protein MutK